jgi:hypothetical protein
VAEIIEFSRHPCIRQWEFTTLANRYLKHIFDEKAKHVMNFKHRILTTKVFQLMT